MKVPAWTLGVIQPLMTELVHLRLKDSPGKAENVVQEEIWDTLHRQASFSPEHPSPSSVESAVWTLMALIELEQDRMRHPQESRSI